MIEKSAMMLKRRTNRKRLLTRGSIERCGEGKLEKGSHERVGEKKTGTGRLSENPGKSGYMRKTGEGREAGW